MIAVPKAVAMADATALTMLLEQRNKSDGLLQIVVAFAYRRRRRRRHVGDGARHLRANRQDDGSHAALGRRRSVDSEIAGAGPPLRNRRHGGGGAGLQEQRRRSATCATEGSGGARVTESETAARTVGPNAPNRPLSDRPRSVRRSCLRTLAHPRGRRSDLFVSSAAFAADYGRCGHDFNAAMGKLQETMRAVVANTDGIRSGAERDFLGLRRSVAAHRAAGRQPGGDRRRARRDHRHGEEDRRRRQARPRRRRRPPRPTPSSPARWCARRSRPWPASRSRRSRSARSSA